MKLIIGLGNPGNEYNHTRHNVGFDVIDRVATKLDIEIKQKKFDCNYYENIDFILIKPLTFMNLSGEAVKKVMDFYKINPSNILVIHDDLDTKLGQAKIKISNSSGGHNGIKSIINKISDSNFYRLKIGIDRPKSKDIAISSYVLGRFKPDEKIIIDKVIDKAAEAVISFIYNDINYVINSFNKKAKNDSNSN